MKGFAIFTLILSIIASLFGGLGVFLSGNNASDFAMAAALLGAGFPGILLSCLVIAVVDIRDRLTPQS